MIDQLDPFAQLLTQSLATIGDYAPRILGAILILFLGWLVASVLRSIIKEVGNRIHLDHWLTKIRADRFFDISFSLTNILGILSYWLVYWVFIIAALEQLNIQAVSEGMNSIIGFFPKIFSALIIMSLGFVFGKVSQDVITHLAQTVKTPHAEGFGAVARFLVILFAVVIGIGELGIDTRFFTQNFSLLFAGLIVWFCVATAVGGQEFCKKMFDQIEQIFSEKKKFKDKK